MQEKELATTVSLEEEKGDEGLLDTVTGILSIEPMDAAIFVGKIIGAGLILWIGFKVVKKIVELLGKALEKAGFSDTLRPFLSSLVSVILKGAVLFAIAGSSRFCNWYGIARKLREFCLWFIDFEFKAI